MIPLTAVGTPDWMDRGACQGQPGIWDHDATPEDHAEAQWVCKNLCPVRADCLKYALDTNADGGVWGGQIFKGKASIPAKRICNTCGTVFQNAGARQFHERTHQTHCAQGHDLTLPDAVKVVQTPTGTTSRECRQCKRDIEARRRKRTTVAERRRGVAA